jgi:hypothetical protein
MATAGREKSTPLAHTGVAVTTRRKSIQGEVMARACELRFGDDEADMKNQ